MCTRDHVLLADGTKILTRQKRSWAGGRCSQQFLHYHTRRAEIGIFRPGRGGRINCGTLILSVRGFPGVPPFYAPGRDLTIANVAGPDWQAVLPQATGREGEEHLPRLRRTAGPAKQFAPRGPPIATPKIEGRTPPNPAFAN